LEEAAGYLAAVEPTVVPRWEWRTFGASFSDVEARFESFPPERMAESDEIYLLSLATDASVKARGGLLDVKRLERVSEDGLELWRPVMKARFPLSTGARRVLARRIPRRGGATELDPPRG
jgi:exopolyphosphatase/guanosine-5'-triphosphate,3'-diphosphate pyrophosphatase